MEWGTFITVISAIYLAWYGLNFLYDLFFTGQPKLEVETGTQYNISDLMGEEEKPQIISEKDFEPKPLAVHKTEDPAPMAPVVSDTPAAGGSGQSIETPSAPAPVPPSALQEQEQGDNSDWAAVIDQEETQDGQEEKINMVVQGQPIAVSDYIQSLKDQAKAEASAITF